MEHISISKCGLRTPGGHKFKRKDRRAVAKGRKDLKSQCNLKVQGSPAPYSACEFMDIFLRPRVSASTGLAAFVLFAVFPNHCFFLFPTFCLETKGGAKNSSRFKKGHLLRSTVVSVESALAPFRYCGVLRTKTPLRAMRRHKRRCIPLSSLGNISTLS
jgi:hypothetical protein